VKEYKANNAKFKLCNFHFFQFIFVLFLFYYIIEINLILSNIIAEI